MLNKNDGILSIQKLQKLEQTPSRNTYDHDLASNRRMKAGRKYSDREGSSRTVKDYERYGMHSVWDNSICEPPSCDEP